MRSSDREGKGGGGGAPAREIVGMRDMRSTHGGVTRTCARRLSFSPTASALSPTVLIHLHRCQGPLPLASLAHRGMGRIAGVKGWGRMAHGSTGHDPGP
jgi:hypothetical protein